MSINLSAQVRKTFGLAGQRNEAKQTLNAPEMKQFNAITDKFKQLAVHENRAFELEYKTRFEMARKRLINKAGSKTKDLQPRWLGTDKFDKSAINRQAQRQVVAAHNRMLAHLKNQMMAEREQLIERSAHRLRLKEKPLIDFQRATDRRSGPERRKPSTTTRLPRRTR